MSVLQRKAQVGKQEHQARAMTVPKALRVGLAKVADDSFNMALAVIGVTQDILPVEQALDAVTDEMLAITLDGPHGAAGGAVLSYELVSAMIQQQTTGRVSATPDSERAMTSTDAALCAPLLDQLFKRANDLLETPEDRDVLPCFKFGARAENARLFGLSLEEPEYTVLRLTVDIAGGVAQASMTLILPLPSAAPEYVSGEKDDGIAPEEVTLQTSVMELKAELSAVLCRITMPLSQVSALETGQELSITSEAFDAVQLLSIDGNLVTSGAMGQVEGQRALMLHHAAGTKSVDAPAKPEPGGEEFPEAGSDYSDLQLPDLELPAGETLIDPDSLDALPDLSSADVLDETSLPDLPDLTDLPDLPDLEDNADLPELPDLDGDLPALEDLPKINIA